MTRAIYIEINNNMNIKIKITNKSNAKELDVNIESIIAIDLEDYVFVA